MKPNLPCCVVHDLLPLYAEQLLSAESAAAVRQHLDGCADCAAEFREMTGIAEPVPGETAEVDYLKKLRRSRKRWILGAVAAALLICGGLALFFGLRAGKARARMDGKTLIVSGTGGYAALELPEEADRATNLDVQDDNFHLSAYLPALTGTGETARSVVPSYLDRTDRSFAFLRTYLQENAADCYPKDLAEQFIELRIQKRGQYVYTHEDGRTVVEIGEMRWHRDDLYVLALLNAESVEWQQIGYAFYLADCVNPYGEMRAEYTPGVEDAPYYEAYRKLGGSFDGTAEDFLRFNHAAAYACLRDGLNWRGGSYYECRAVTEFGYYTGPEKGLGGNQLSPAMAVSLIGWLTERFGFDKVSAYCFGKLGFMEAFGVSYPEAYDAWSAWLTAACA